MAWGDLCWKNVDFCQYSGDSYFHPASVVVVASVGPAYLIELVGCVCSFLEFYFFKVHFLRLKFGCLLFIFLKGMAVPLKSNATPN